MGPLALAGAGIVTAVGRFGETPSRSASAAAGALQSSGNIAAVRSRSLLLLATAGTYLLLLVVLTWRQTAVYHNLVTLYTATLTRNPSCWMAHYNLGIALNKQGDTDGAIVHYRQALELRPSYAEAHYNLGRLLVQKGQLDEAITHYEKALEINPGAADAHNNLGAALFAGGRVDEAIAQYRKALVAQPDYADASCNLASALLSKNDLDGAIAYYSACLATSPNQPEAQYNLASALFRRGRTDEAITHYQKALELSPDNADAHANLGSAFLAKGRVRDAIAEYNMRSGLRMITWLPRAIWHGCWRQLPTQRFEMDQRPSFWPSAQNLKAPGAKIIQLFCASLLRHTLRPAVLLRLRKLLNRHWKPHRSKGTPACRVRCGTKSRCTSSGLPYHKQAR